ncbi:hypothetical protein EG68_07027 [Paragonimus skrjabini miyazakii]|uniref:Uncharacterized protein n=1 Tax=Paragonimus skrjabini miyazakii TaxID=59628 RepID=A0A8S9YM33_9TREM|nr:hypothetical protein EG68_07027 [Paragonimus skrjabini miyazakii]
MNFIRKNIHDFGEKILQTIYLANLGLIGGAACKNNTIIVNTAMTIHLAHFVSGSSKLDEEYRFHVELNNHSLSVETITYVSSLISTVVIQTHEW